MDKKLCDDIYAQGKDCMITQIKYSPRKTKLFSLTQRGFFVFLSALGTVKPGHTIKVKASRQSKFS